MQRIFDAARATVAKVPLLFTISTIPPNQPLIRFRYEHRAASSNPFHIIFYDTSNSTIHTNSRRIIIIITIVLIKLSREVCRMGA